VAWTAKQWTLGATMLLVAGAAGMAACHAHAKGAAPGAAGASLTAEVAPLIGTGKGPGGSINLFPGPAMPFGMVQLSPDTEDHGYGYHDYDPEIHGFSMTHMSGPGCPNEGDVFFTATTGPVRTQVANFASPYSHAQEIAAPGYYAVLLSRWGVHAQLTATDRTGMARFTFPAGKPANVLVPISHTLNHTDAAAVRIAGDREITGAVTDEVFCGAGHPYTVYFAMRFSRPFSSYGVWRGAKGRGRIAAHGRSAGQTRHGQWIGAYARWPAARRPRVVTVRVGISYVDPRGAENNLRVESEGKSFAQLRRAANAAWDRALGVIGVSGGTPAERKVFYTALYHSLLMPSIFSDADGRYLGFDGRIHHAAPGHLIYANYSGWDIYRSEMPLLAMIAPRRMADMCESIVKMIQQGGWIGRWPQINRFTNVMAGSPLSVVMATAWLDGIHGFDMKAAWPGMYQDATVAPPRGRPYQGEQGIRWINRLHYVPNDKVRYGSVSQIQEDAIAYASLYDLARALHLPAAARVLYQRALYYRNVFDPAGHFFRPRDSDGKWTPHFDPSREGHGFIEGSGWHYQWLAPADLAWLIHAVGPARFNRRLEHFFAYKAPVWSGQYYNPYNETDLEAPFEFDFSGRPWRTQAVVRRILRQNYGTTPDGVPGNDDCGEMSSWAVMSMMGMYSVDPASTAYELASPVFRRVVIHLHAPYTGRSFVITAPGASRRNAYIQAVRLNGKTVGQDWLPFAAIRRGGRLRVTLGPEPDRSWAAAPKDAPPSLSTSARPAA
jgi:predicted alpha-1,2-mannosidase